VIAEYSAGGGGGGSGSGSGSGSARGVIDVAGHYIGFQPFFAIFADGLSVLEKEKHRGTVLSRVG
jgi:hypothetical protein